MLRKRKATRAVAPHAPHAAGSEKGRERAEKRPQKWNNEEVLTNILKLGGHRS